MSQWNMRVPYREIARCPVLHKFMAIYETGYSDNSDIRYWDVPTDQIMVDIWDKLGPEAICEVCDYLKRFDHYKNMHPGLLGLMNVHKVILTLRCEPPITFQGNLFGGNVRWMTPTEVEYKI